LQYDLHQDNKNSALFIMYERWTNKEALIAHMKAPHFVNFQKVAGKHLAGISLNEMHKKPAL